MGKNAEGTELGLRCGPLCLFKGQGSRAQGALGGWFQFYKGPQGRRAQNTGLCPAGLYSWTFPKLVLPWAPFSY